MNEELWQAFVQITGSFNAMLLGTILIFGPRARKTFAASKLGWALLIYAYLLIAFTAIDNLWIPISRWLLYVDYFLVLTASALFLDYIHEVMTRRPVSRLFYLPAPLFVVAAMILPSGFMPAIALNCLIGIQLGYTVLTTFIFVRESRRLVQSPRHLKLLLIGLWALHLAQAARIAFPASTLLFDLVPLVGAVLMVLLTAFVLTDSRALRPFTRVMSTSTVSARSMDSIEQYMREERPFLDPRLTLEQLSAALGLSRGELSMLIGSTTYGNFYDFINHFRVLQAQEFLSDPNEARTSVEAVGLMSGFKARSTFYEYFRRHTGMTPAQYRTTLSSRE